MKIVAGLGCIEDYIRLAKAGADEVFCGYVPYVWNKRYGTLFPLNRREVMYYNVQIGSLEDMKILKKMVDVYNVPVTVTFNYLYYLEEQYEFIESIMKDLISIGFNEFIIADPALILYLQKKKIKCSIHLSGECAEVNRFSIDFFNKFKNISRYIFHRKNTIEDMESCITNNKEKSIEYEAFILNELCHYTGAFCSSLHCDEMSHLCKISYHMAKINTDISHFKSVDKNLKNYFNEYNEEDFLVDDEKEEYLQNYETEDYDDEIDTYKLGNTGCGLCSLKKLKKAGVTHLKVVGRGNHIEYMERDVRYLKKAINMLDNKEACTDYCTKIKDNFFHGNCSGECYYLLDK